MSVVNLLSLGYSKHLELDVSWVILECLKGVYKESRRCFRGVSWTFYRIAMEFASNFQVVSTHRGFNGVLKVFHLFFKGFQGSFETFELSL